jgi:hypothetical protein
MSPFQTTLVRLQLPEGAGDSISVRGFSLQADADRCVEVPQDVAADLASHGLTPPAAKPAKK